MRGNRFYLIVLPLLLAASLGACATNGVQPGVVSRSGPSQGYGQNTGYGQNQGYSQNQGQNQGYVQNASATGGPVAGTTPLDPNDPAAAQGGGQGGGGSSYPQSASASSGDSGRVVSINDVSLQGGGGGSGGGPGNGTLVGGLLGGLGGAAIGVASGHSLGGGLIGGLLGAVGGAIAGSIYDQHGGGGGGGSGGRGIEVTVQRDDGQKMTVAQRDDGDIQLGDRVQVVQDRNGTAKVVRDTSRNPD